MKTRYRLTPEDVIEACGAFVANRLGVHPDNLHLRSATVTCRSSDTDPFITLEMPFVDIEIDTSDGKRDGVKR
jgi:hypothetical protein